MDGYGRWVWGFFLFFSFPCAACTSIWHKVLSENETRFSFLCWSHGCVCVMVTVFSDTKSTNVSIVGAFGVRDTVDRVS